MKIIQNIIFLFLSFSTWAWAYHQQDIVNMANLHQWHWQALPFPSIDGNYNVVVMKNNPNTMFIYGPYSPNTKMYKSNDEGKHWEAIASPKVNTLHHLISLDVNRLLLAGDNHIYLSMDQGEHWALTATLDQSCDKLFSPVPNLVLLTTNFNDAMPGLYRSTDGGKTFAPARLGIQEEGPPFFAMGGQEDVLVVGTDGIFLSTDRGLLWQQPSLAWKDKLLSSVAINHQFAIFLAADHLLYQTDMSGQKWETVDTHLGSIKNIAVDANDRLYTVSQQDGDGLYRSMDNGKTWELLHRFNQIIEFDFVKDGKILVNTDQGLMLSDEAQLNYVKLTELPFANATVGHVVALNQHDFFATAFEYAGPLYASDDAGKTWMIKRNTGILDVVAFNDKLVVLEYSGDDQQVMVSDNSGNTWQAAFPISKNYCYSLSSQNGGLIVNCRNESYFTSDLLHWTPFTIADKRPILSSYFSGKILYVTDGNFIQRSDDHGLSWKCLLNHLNQAHAYISGYNDDVLIIAINQAGIIKMTNDGKTWGPINQGLTNFNFTSLLVISPTQYLVSTDNGIFYTQNGGQSWVEENSGLNNLMVLSLARYQTTLLAGTEGGGIFKTE